jgi:uncharacterized protein (TIGR03435 family)
MNTLALFAALLAAPASAAPKAPNFKVAVVRNAPAAKIYGLSDLKGKIVYLDFWATWCQPCVAGIPRTNRLIDSLKGQPVVFLSITDEPADVIEKFQKTHEIKSWVGIDEAGSVIKAYHVVGRPTGYLIGKDGALLAEIAPEDLNEGDVRSAIAGLFVPKPVAWAGAPKNQAAVAAAEKPYFEVRISPASGEPTLISGDDGLEARSLDFASNVAWIWKMERDQVLVDSAPVAGFNFSLKSPRGGIEGGRELLKSAVQSAFHVTVAPEKRETDALVLTLSAAKDSPRPKLGAEGVKSGLMASGGGRLLGKAPMSEVAHSLWMSLQMPVIDETGLKGDYDFDLEWKYGDRAALDGLLASQGLTLVPARRTVEFLRVASVKP